MAACTAREEEQEGVAGFLWMASEQCLEIFLIGGISGFWTEFWVKIWYQNQKITPHRTWPAANWRSQSNGTRNSLQPAACMPFYKGLENRRL